MKSLLVAFAMYTKIPVPTVTWDGKSLKYVYLWFPVIGAIIGALMFGWHALAVHFGVNSMLFAVVATVLPIIITGGIHIDGFIDTMDAISSYGDREKRLEIMKDPHVGAFGVIMCGMYLLLNAGIWAQVYDKPRFLLIALIGFAVSRTLAGLSVIVLPPARDTGLARTFSDGAGKKPVATVLIVYLAALIAGLVWVSVPAGTGTVVFVALLVLWFKMMTKKTFGGITGDLAGYLLQCTELLILSAAAIGGIIWS